VNAIKTMVRTLGDQYNNWRVGRRFFDAPKRFTKAYTMEKPPRSNNTIPGGLSLIPIIDVITIDTIPIINHITVTIALLFGRSCPD